MSNLSDFLTLGGSGAVKTAYYTTSGSKVLVPHGGVDKLVYIVRGENDGYWYFTGESPLTVDEPDIVKITADLTIEVEISTASPGAREYAAIRYITQEV